MLGSTEPEFTVIDENDYFTYKNAFRNTFLMTTLSNYPNAAIPFLKNQDIYALYFVPFLVLVLTILIPIPTAVVFDWFWGNRMKVLLEDWLWEKEGLFLAFVCLDYKWQGFINLDQWMKFIDAVFKGINNKDKTKKVFQELDKKKIGYLDVEQFF